VIRRAIESLCSAARANSGRASMQGIAPIWTHASFLAAAVAHEAETTQPSRGDARFGVHAGTRV